MRVARKHRWIVVGFTRRQAKPGVVERDDAESMPRERVEECWIPHVHVAAEARASHDRSAVADRAVSKTTAFALDELVRCTDRIGDGRLHASVSAIGAAVIVTHDSVGESWRAAASQ